MLGFRACVVATLLLLITGCGREQPAVVYTPDEQRLLELLTIDPFIEIIETERDSQGRLVVTTRQGDTRARYRFAALAGGPLDIHRLDDHPRLDVADDGSKGTGPEARGLR